MLVVVVEVAVGLGVEVDSGVEAGMAVEGKVAPGVVVPTAAQSDRKLPG